MYNQIYEQVVANLKKMKDKTSDLYEGLDAAHEKLTYYYDQLSPVCAVIVLLDPRQGVEKLKKIWKTSWIKQAKGWFLQAVQHYKENMGMFVNILCFNLYSFIQGSV